MEILHLSSWVGSPHIGVPFTLDGFLDTADSLTCSFDGSPTEGIVAVFELFNDFLFRVATDRYITTIAVDPSAEEVRMVVAFEYHFEVNMGMLQLEVVQLLRHQQRTNTIG